ncbi:MAG TPA: patatin-like phospholipase family protein [Xanthomonadales bacterium]|nr:patatin-like phospholipase family protein [Xanthomonadales bacterium]
MTRFVVHTALFLALLCVTLATAEVFAAPADTAETTTRPRIGLVLGGGGAKGAAHIGVLRVLDELRIPIDCVAGTSMGALIGGTFASGMPAEEIATATTAIDWSRTVGGTGMRDRTPIERKIAGSNYSNELEFGLRGGAVVLPGGLIKTQDIEDVIRQLVNNARFQRDFDKLPIPFRAVATDMVSGDMVVLGSGDLSVAMRASMAVPGAFSPVIMGDQVLSDGGMVRNVPIDIARELCADVVIAVWLVSPQPKAADLDSALALAARSMDVMIEANVQAQLSTLTPADVGIAVHMGDIGTGDFQRVADAIVLGQAAAEAHKDELRRFSVTESDYLAWRASVTSPEAQPVYLADVEIKGLNHVSQEYVEASLKNLKPGAEVDSREIKEDTDRIYALGDFERIEYQLKGTPEARIMEISPIEKSWGPNFLAFDIGLSGEESGEVLALLRAEHTRAWIGERGAAWNNVLQIGRESRLSTEFYQPLDAAQNWFVRTGVRWENELQDVYIDSDRVASYFVKDLYGELAVGTNLGTRAQLAAGLRGGVVRTERDTGAVVLPEHGNEVDNRLFLSAVYDTRDNVGLPTRGSLIYLNYINSGSWLGGEQDYSLVEGVLTKSFPWRGDSFSVILGGGQELSGDLPPDRDFRLGGIRSFPGLRFDELRGNSYWFAGTSYLWKLADIQPLLGQALYAGLRLQAGRMTGRPLLENSDTRYGISGSLNGSTPVGPFILSLGYVDDGSLDLQFTIGRPVPEGSALDAIY